MLLISLGSLVLTHVPLIWIAFKTTTTTTATRIIQNNWSTWNAQRMYIYICYLEYDVANANARVKRRRVYTFDWASKQNEDLSLFEWARVGEGERERACAPTWKNFDDEDAVLELEAVALLRLADGRYHLLILVRARRAIAAARTRRKRRRWELQLLTVATTTTVAIHGGNVAGSRRWGRRRWRQNRSNALVVTLTMRVS